jgi:predicted dehydrogenase
MPDVLRVLLIGYGSIGKKHLANLVKLGTEPYVITQYPNHANAQFIHDIRDIRDIPISRCIIASPTARHLQDFESCFSLIVPPSDVLIEKPIESSYSKAKKIQTLSDEYNVNTYVGYNLRFLNAFDLVKEFIERHRQELRIIEVVAGHDLKQWRPDAKYAAKSYSAYREQGGGVDLDLSHEIDYVLWLFGSKYNTKLMYRNKISLLKGDSPDIFKLILDYHTFVVDITLDYIRKTKERFIKVICEDGNHLLYDLTSNVCQINDENFQCEDSVAGTYEKMLRAFLSHQNKDKTRLCSIEQSLNVLKVLEL